MRMALFGIAALAVGLSGCTQAGSQTQQAAIGVAAGMATQFDPTGLSTTALIASRVAQSRARMQEFKEMQANPQKVQLATMFTPLQDVANGKTALRTGDISDAKGALAIQHSVGIAGAVVRGATAGPVGMIMAVPEVAFRAADAGRTAAVVGSAEARFAQYEAKRSTERAVPNEDRPAEAQAILTILGEPLGRSVTWANPATGATGKATLQSAPHIYEGVQCRLLAQEWRRGGERRKGQVAVCNQDGVWYDLTS
jgi:hypothetical protein